MSRRSLCSREVRQSTPYGYYFMAGLGTASRSENTEIQIKPFIKDPISKSAMRFFH
jgi:hypothetical protein